METTTCSSQVPRWRHNLYRLSYLFSSLFFLLSIQASELSESLWAVQINDNELPSPILLIKRDHRLLVGQKDLNTLRLNPPPNRDSIDILGAQYYYLEDLKGLTYEFDDPNQILKIKASTEAFQPNQLSLQTTQVVEAKEPPLGAYLDYQINGEIGQTAHTNALFEAGMFSRFGVATHSILAQELHSNERQWVRLETAFRKDWPEHRTSLILGDTLSSAGSWGIPSRFGGIRWGTNFSTQPYFIPSPFASVTGEVSLSSTASIYIDQSLVSNLNIPPGPFSVTNLPAVTGGHELRMVIRDIYGVERVVTSPYYISPRLLREGLAEYSLEAGVLRQHFGTVSNDYGSLFSIANYRFGITESFTGEGRLEVMEDRQSAGLGGVYAWPDIGSVNGAFSLSRSNSGQGFYSAIGFERQMPRWSFFSRLEYSSPKFSQVGLDSKILDSRLFGVAQTNFSLGQFGTVGFGFFHSKQPGQADKNWINANYNVSLGSLGSLSLSGRHDLDGSNDTSIFLSLTFSLDEATSFSSLNSMTTTEQGTSFEPQVQVQRNLPLGPGFGYRLLAGLGDQKYFSGDVAMQNDFGQFNLSASHLNQKTRFLGAARGSIAMMAGDVFFSRQLADGFGVVHVGDYSNVGVYRNNQLVARTNSQGEALVPQMLPYQKNVIRIEANDLPLDTQIDVMELDAVPYFRSGVVLDFPIKKGGLLNIVLEDGTAMPSGALVSVEGSDEEFPVALDGEVYITNLTQNANLRASWRGQVCQFSATFEISQEPLPHYGTFLCKGVKQ